MGKIATRNEVGYRNRNITYIEDPNKCATKSWLNGLYYGETYDDFFYIRNDSSYKDNQLLQLDDMFSLTPTVFIRLTILDGSSHINLHMHFADAYRIDMDMNPNNSSTKSVDRLFRPTYSKDMIEPTPSFVFQRSTSSHFEISDMEIYDFTITTNGSTGIQWRNKNAGTIEITGSPGILTTVGLYTELIGLVWLNCE